MRAHFSREAGPSAPCNSFSQCLCPRRKPWAFFLRFLNAVQKLSEVRTTMMQKLRVLPIGCARQCPFYVKDQADAAYCFIKATTAPHIAVSLMEDASHYDASTWSEECGGAYEKCSIIPLLWNLREAAQSAPQPVPVDSDIDDYDPFAAEEDAEEASAEPTPDARGDGENTSDSQVVGEREGNEDSVGEEAVEPTVQVSIHQVSNPYAVKCDVLVYPTNIVLTVDDPLLNRLSKGVIQQECDAMPRPVKMGHVYATSNGGEHSGVRAKTVFQAVVAGPSRLVNESDVNSAMMKSLILAESVHAENMVVMPFDCGTHDINNIARVQLAAVNKFLRTHETKSLKRIFFVMEDEDSIEVFEEYFDRIFEG